MKRNRYSEHPEALAFIQKHRRELSPESYEEDTSDPVSTSAARRHATPEAGDSKSFTDFLHVLELADQELYRNYVSIPYGGAQKLARRYGYANSKALGNRVRDLRERMKKAARKYRAALSRRTGFMPPEDIGRCLHAEVQLGYGEDSETVFLVYYADELTWVDSEGCSFHGDVTTVLNSLYEVSGSFEDIEVNVIGRSDLS